MSSEPEENAELPDKLTSEPEVLDKDVPGTNGPIENAKPKRRRRGKKRKHRKESAATCESENVEECDGELQAESEHETPDSPPWDSDQDLSCGGVSSLTDVIIRPINVPKAPENSTQFIMDDHNECRLYMSFETPNPYSADPSDLHEKEGVIIEPTEEDAAYRDIDYEYESPQDFDNSAYYDREFEQSYKSNRLEELMRLPHTELIGMLHSLESRSKELNDDLVKENPSPMLDKLQHELLQLQEKHNYLQECNAKLTGLVRLPDNGAALDSSGSLTVSQDSISYSDGDVCKDYSDACCKPSNESQLESRSANHFSETGVVRLTDSASGPSRSDIVFDSSEVSYCVDSSDIYGGSRSVDGVLLNAQDKFPGVVPCEEYSQNLLSSE